MAGWQIKPFKGASDLYDAGHGHVYAEKIQPLPDNLKKKISVILEAIPSKSKSEIAEALQACDYDITRALNYFVADGEMEEEQNEWKVQGKRKKKKKKSGKKSAKEPTDSQSQNDAEGSTATASVASPDSTTEKPTEAEQKKVEQNIPAETAPKGNPTGVPKTTNNESPKSLKNLKPVSNDVPKSNETTPTPTSPPLSPPSLSSPLLSPTDSVSSSQDLQTLSKSRAGSSSNDKHPRQRTTSGSGSDIFKKTLKDLQRSAVSISRYQSMLDEHAESSTRMLAKSFQAIREALDEREKCLEEQLKSVTEETKKLLEERQEDAAGLKFKCNRAGTMSDEETAELRNEIKHFVGERRIDEDLGKTILFLRDEEKMLEAVRNFGEVPAIKHHYTSYKRKHPEPSKPVSYKPPPVKTSTASSSHNTSTTPTTTNVATTSTSNEMKNGNSRNEKRQVLSPAGLKDQAEIHARLQQAVKEQQVSPVSKESAKQSGRNAGEKPKPKDFGPKSNRNNGKEQQPRRDQTSQRQRQTSSSQNSTKSFGNRNENKSTYSSENSKTPVQADGAKVQDGSPTNGVSQTQEPAENGAQTGSSADNRTQAREDKPAEGSHVSHNLGYRRTKRRYFRKTPTSDGSPVFRAGTVNTSNNTSTSKEDGGQSKAKNSDLPNGQLESPMTNGTNGFVPLSQRNRRPRKFYMKKDPGSKIEFPPPRENGSVPA